MFCTYVDHIFSKLGQRATESNEKKNHLCVRTLFYQINTRYLGAVHKLRQVFFEDFRPPPLPPLVRRSQIWWTPLNNDVRFEYPLPPYLIHNK